MQLCPCERTAEQPSSSPTPRRKRLFNSPAPRLLSQYFLDTDTLARAVKHQQRQLRCVAGLFFMLGNLLLCIALGFHLIT